MSNSVNRKYAKLVIDGENQRLEYAPSSFAVPGIGVIGNPSREDYVRNGWKEVYDFPFPPKEGFYVVRDGYEENDKQIIVKYKYEQAEVQPRHWTPLSIKRTTQKYAVPDTNQTMWDALKGVLDSAGCYEDFVIAQYIAEDDVMFKAAYAKAVERFGKELIDKIIAEIPQD